MGVWEMAKKGGKKKGGNVKQRAVSDGDGGDATAHGPLISSIVDGGLLPSARLRLAPCSGNVRGATSARCLPALAKAFCIFRDHCLAQLS